jgi:predicted nucleotidyltransferase
MFHGELVEALLKSPDVKLSQVILAFASGSSQHGARIEGKSDLDVAGVYVGSPLFELAIGNEDPRKKGHVTQGTSDQYEKNTAADTDLKAYTLRRWAGLAMKGNPTILSYLFAPTAIKDSYITHPSVWDLYILPNRSLFLASSHAACFLGLGESQYKRMLGIGTGKHGQRDELIDVHGYDTKAAMHMVRSMDECLEFLQTGFMTFPRPNVSTLLEIRRGEWGMERIKDEYNRLRAAVQEAELTSPLPPNCDREAINKVVVEAMIHHWKREGDI